MTCTRPSRAIRVAVADDQLFVRSGLRRFTSSFPGDDDGFRTQGDASSSAGARR